jgi:hypothetical protein
MALGLLLIRAVIGLTLAAHGAQKLFGSFGGGGPTGTTTFFRRLLQLSRGYEFNLVIVAAALGIAAIGPGRYSLDQALGWAETISGPWSTLGVAALAALIAFVTLTVGRTHTTPQAREDLPVAPSNRRGRGALHRGDAVEARGRKERTA